VCIKNWFKPKPPIVVPDEKPVQRKLLTFGRNTYGGGNDLNGCVNDSNNLSKALLEIFPDFEVRKFTDYEVTIAKYKAEVSAAIATLKPGATVLILPDSCFSGTITREMKRHKNRFFHNPDLKSDNKTSVRLFKSVGDIRWIVISGSQEHQTSADAFINGSYVGAFTYFAIKALMKGLTYKEWYIAIRKYLPSEDFYQSPTLEGPEELLDRKVFEGETLVIHNSSHGTYVTCKEGDEADGVDEALYFDKPITDDEINALLQKIP
jgi:hypothetical protein